MLHTIEGSKLYTLSLMKEHGGVPRFTLPTRVYTHAGETAAHASQCRRRKQVQGRVISGVGKSNKLGGLDLW